MRLASIGRAEDSGDTAKWLHSLHADQRWLFGDLKASDSLGQLPLEPNSQIPHILTDHGCGGGWKSSAT